VPPQALYDVTAKLMMRSLRNDAQQTYSQGTHIFLHQTEQDVDDEKYFAMSLAVLNDMLERAKRQDLEHRASVGSRMQLSTRTKRAVPGADEYFGDAVSRNDPNLLVAKFPTTLEARALAHAIARY